MQVQWWNCRISPLPAIYSLRCLLKNQKKYQQYNGRSTKTSTFFQYYRRQTNDTYESHNFLLSKMLSITLLRSPISTTTRARSYFNIPFSYIGAKVLLGLRDHKNSSKTIKYVCVKENIQPTAVSVTESTTTFLQTSATKLLNALKIAEYICSSVWLVSTMKRRRTKMNKHKLKKRSKKMRMTTKLSRS